MSALTIAAVQLTPVFGDPEATLAKAEGFVQQAARSGAALACFPEQFATGWDPASTRHVQGPDGPLVTAYRSLAWKYRVAILGAFREKTGGLPRNTAVAVGPGGDILATYAKIHPFSPGGEDRYYRPGDCPVMFTLGGVRFGLAICYDLRFAGLFNQYAANGADCVIVQSAWPAARMRHWDLFIAARAAEFQLYVLGVNTTGVTPVDTYCGGSLLADPAGDIEASIGGEEGIMTVVIDPEAVREARERLPVWKDRMNRGE